MSKLFITGALALMSLCRTPANETPPSEPYSWHNVVIGGGGFVAGIVFHPRQKGLIYAHLRAGLFRYRRSRHHLRRLGSDPLNNGSPVL